jgi:hypothetical protein
MYEVMDLNGLSRCIPLDTLRPRVVGTYSPSQESVYYKGGAAYTEAYDLYSGSLRLYHPTKDMKVRRTVAIMLRVTGVVVVVVTLSSASSFSPSSPSSSPP